MTDIAWGPEIAVNGVWPRWLRDDIVGLFEKAPDRWVGDRPLTEWTWSRTENGGKGWPIRIRLPADHFAYVAIDKGFEPWGGGDAAPYDWDGDAYGVLYRDGLTIGRKAIRWEKHDQDNDIIGYRKRTKTPADTVTIARMTEAQVAILVEDLCNRLPNKMEMASHSWRRRWDAYRFIIPAVLAALDLTRTETQAERFARETGQEITPAVLAALEFER